MKEGNGGIQYSQNRQMASGTQWPKVCERGIDPEGADDLYLGSKKDMGNPFEFRV